MNEIINLFRAAVEGLTVPPSFRYEAFVWDVPSNQFVPVRGVDVVYPVVRMSITGAVSDRPAPNFTEYTVVLDYAETHVQNLTGVPDIQQRGWDVRQSVVNAVRAGGLKAQPWRTAYFHSLTNSLEAGATLTGVFVDKTAWTPCC